MNNKYAGTILVVALVATSVPHVVSAAAGTRTVLKSPDGRLAVTIRAAQGPGGTNSPLFSVRFRGRELLQQSTLGLVLEGKGDFLAGATLTSVRREAHDETYLVLAGKQNPVRNHYRQAELKFKSPGGFQIRVIVRAFNDGVAFRYAIPAQPGLNAVSITDERTLFRLAGDPQAHVLRLESYTTSYEGLYTKATLRTLHLDQLFAVPALFEYEDGTAVAIAEANLQRYAGMYLKRRAGAEGDGLVSDLSPLPNQKEIKVRVPTPMVSPWRVIMVGENAGQLIESSVIVNLNEPSTLTDTSWIKPGKTTWPWWNGTEGELAGFETKLDLRTMKHYIDFCARHNITYHALVTTAESDMYPWYQQSGKDFAPGPDTDVLKPRPEIQFDELARYAASKGVALRAWVHWKAIEGRLDEVFSAYQKWGIRGLMVDFLDRNDQEMVEFTEEVLKKAAEHQLHIQFHGVWAPTGRSRTYPNLFNHEGVLNLEYLKWGNKCSPDHNLIVPFTRMLAGPIDYHLGGFRAVRREDFKPRGVAPIVLGTRCHHLAMYVVYENPMPMVVDYPTAYENQPGFDLIEQIPAVWDETRVLSSKVGEYIVLARRSGKKWYIAAMTNWTPRELEVPLTLLSPGDYTAEVWSDGTETTTNPNFLVKSQRSVSAKDRIKVKLESGGGWVMHIRL